jgi:hypothetical protein
MNIVASLFYRYDGRLVRPTCDAAEALPAAEAARRMDAGLLRYCEEGPAR